MSYIIAFLEGLLTFISPCLLPMLPIYVTYFAGGGERSSKKTIVRALGFILGFTAVFVSMGALASTVGGFLAKYKTAVNIVSGIIVIFLGLNFIGVFKLNIFKGQMKALNTENMSFFSAVLFGIIFSVGWTPCVGAFLGSALMMASTSGTVLKGVMMLLFYSLGLGVPFMISAILIDYLKGAFNFIKKHYNVINMISGCLLVIIGILMATGLLGRFLV